VAFKLKTLAREYDLWHERVFNSCPEHCDESSPWYELVRKHLVPLEGKRVLEVGCGRGGFVHVLTSLKAVAFGCDFSASALQIARNRLRLDGLDSCVSLAQADAHHLPYADSSFDLIISCEALEHLLDPSAALREMARVCRPGGWLYLTTPNYMNLIGLYEVYASIFRKNGELPYDQPFDRKWTFLQVRTKLRNAGWEIACSDGTVHQVPVPGRNPIRLKFLECHRLIRRAISPFALHYMLLAHKGTGQT